MSDAALRDLLAGRTRGVLVTQRANGQPQLSFVVADATAELTPVATGPDDATVEELIDVYRAVGGEHPDWDEFRSAMVRDRRLVARLRVQGLYGHARA